MLTLWIKEKPLIGVKCPGSSIGKSSCLLSNRFQVRILIGIIIAATKQRLAAASIYQSLLRSLKMLTKVLTRQVASV